MSTPQTQNDAAPRDASTDHLFPVESLTEEEPAAPQPAAPESAAPESAAPEPKTVIEYVRPGATTPPSGQKAKRRSAFRKSAKFTAGQFQWYDATFFYKEIDDATEEGIKKHFEKIAAEFGITLEDVANEDFSNARIDGKEQINKLLAMLEASYDYILSQCLTDWDDPEFDYDPREIPGLGYEMKAECARQIRRSSEYGMSQSVFTSAQSNR